MMDMREIREMFFDNSIRPEVIVHIGTQCMDDDTWPDAAKDAFFDDFDMVWKAIGIEPPEEDNQIWVIEEYLRDNKIFGFLVCFATPIPQEITDSGYSFSWGYYTTEWIYAETYESACEKAVKWHEDYISKMRGKENEAGE